MMYLCSMNYVHAFISMLNEMSPYLLLGFLIAGVLHAFVPSSIYSRYLSGTGWRSVVTAALFGIPAAAVLRVACCPLPWRCAAVVPRVRLPHRS